MAELIAGRYRIEGVLGRGAMGVVHRAHDTVLDRTVALKELVPPPGLDPAEAVERFLVEARAAARLRHPAIVTVHDVVSDGERVLLAMELLEGRTLAEALADAGGGLPPETVRYIMAQVAAALAEAHAMGVVHRDLKPENVFWLDTHRVVVCDFGLARIGAGRGTRVGTVMGTPGYLAPEQVRGEHAGPAADVFGWGALAYELLTGVPAFGPLDAEFLAVALRVVNDDPPPLHVPSDPALAALVVRCLAKGPAARPPDGSALLVALEQDGFAPAPGPAPRGAAAPPRRGLRPATAAAVGLGLLAVVLAVVVALVAGRGEGGADTAAPLLPPVDLDVDVTGPSSTVVQAGTTTTTADASTSVEIRPVGAHASAERDPVFLRCTDSYVSYTADKLIDGDDNTGWGAGHDDGTGQSITVQFGRAVRLTRVGLTPGYLKVGPRASAACQMTEAFGYNRFVTAVRYEMDGGRSVEQRFENRPALQMIDVDATTTRVTITILGTSLPPGADDDTILSEARFEGIV